MEGIMPSMPDNVDVWSLIPIAVVFIIALFSNLIAFGNRFVNALVTAIILAACLVLATFLRGTLIESTWLMFAVAAVFVADIIGNWINFSNRLANAVVTTLVFAVLFVGAVWVSGLFLVLAGA
jgi:hypothetical protein